MARRRCSIYSVVTIGIKRFISPLLLFVIMLFSLVSAVGGEEEVSDPTNTFGDLAVLEDANDPVTFTVFVFRLCYPIRQNYY